MNDLRSLLSGNPYPGRGILCARTGSGEAFAGYFLTGRSPASRDRVFRVSGNSLIVESASAREHDPLRHYTAFLVTDQWLVFGNGDQVEKVAARAEAGESAAEALGGLSYEPDPPILTSRITALLSRDQGRVAVLGAARPSTGRRTSANVMALTVSGFEPGEGVLLTTYRSNGQNVATAAPYDEISVRAGNGAELLEEIWSGLNPKFRIAAAVVDPAAGPATSLSRS